MSRIAQTRASLVSLDREIAAVEEGLETFQEPESAKEGEQRPEQDKAAHGRDASASGEGALFRAIASERLHSLKRKREELEAELGKAAEDPESSSEGEGEREKRVKSESGSGFVETERDRLIRIGVLTPFDRIQGFERRVRQDEEGQPAGELDDKVTRSVRKTVAAYAAIAAARPTTKLVDPSEVPSLEPPTREFRRLRRIGKPRTEDVGGGTKSAKRRVRRPQAGEKWRNRRDSASEDEDSEDGGSKGRSVEGEDSEGEEELPSGEEPTEDVVLEGGLRIPRIVFDRLFEYQKTGVKWLWELHCQKTGGIIGDEMGLGKTVQVIAFLAALHNSNMYKPSIVVCPVTLLRQWRREVQKWYPTFKPEIMHDSASSSGRQGSRQKVDSEDEDTDVDSDAAEERGKPAKADRWDSLIKRVAKSKSGLILTSYEQLRLFKDKLLDIQWGYAVLDEGHRIRNPDSDTTLVCKQLRTVHRIIMTGAPIQNRLTELWSLFDFVFPGKLGVLPVFEAEFAVPIRVGGYANALPLQVSTAFKCAVVLRDLVLPYLLRRMKSDVEACLPKKTEQVLFCTLTQEQRASYRSFISSSEVEQIFEGKRNSLFGIDILRKICNHPDLLEQEVSSGHADYGNYERSGKLTVLAGLLKVWKGEGHKVLVFTQTQQMLDILQAYVVAQEYVYRRMDGSTPVKQRMSLIDEFNESPEVFVFILTTKVGGLGTNLVGANRVVIYDPDWNPSTDIQARERAWRIGQKREVIVYRLITRGTIEEKVYHRQIHKQLLTNKILKDPHQRRFFKSKDLRDLFTLQDDSISSQTETASLFADAEGHVTPRSGDRNKKSSGSRSRSQKQSGEVNASGPKEADEEGDSETKLLKSLFGANGIHSAVDHDAILSLMDKEKVQVDMDASRIAQRAAEALLESRRLRSNDNIAVPTWTGRNGAAGAPASLRGRFGAATRLVSESSSRPAAGNGISAGYSSGTALSSGDLLSRLQNRNSSGAESGRASVSSPPNNGSNGQAPRSRIIPLPHEVLARQLCRFLQENGGVSTSARVSEHFKSRVTGSDVPVFKRLLHVVATLKADGGVTAWHLKEEFHDV